MTKTITVNVLSTYSKSVANNSTNPQTYCAVVDTDGGTSYLWDSTQLLLNGAAATLGDVVQFVKDSNVVQADLTFGGGTVTSANFYA